MPSIICGPKGVISYKDHTKSNSFGRATIFQSWAEAGIGVQQDATYWIWTKGSYDNIYKFQHVLLFGALFTEYYPYILPRIQRGPPHPRPRRRLVHKLHVIICQYMRKDKLHHCSGIKPPGTNNLAITKKVPRVGGIHKVGGRFCLPGL